MESTTHKPKKRGDNSCFFQKGLSQTFSNELLGSRTFQSEYDLTRPERHILLRSTLGERFVIFGDPVVDGIPVHARREDSRFLVTWTGDVQNLRHFE